MFFSSSLSSTNRIPFIYTVQKHFGWAGGKFFFIQIWIVPYSLKFRLEDSNPNHSPNPRNAYIWGICRILCISPYQMTKRYSGLRLMNIHDLAPVSRTKRKFAHHTWVGSGVDPTWNSNGMFLPLKTQIRGQKKAPCINDCNVINCYEWTPNFFESLWTNGR